MAITYVCGMDHYGPVAPVAVTALPSSTGFGAIIDAYLGDGWSSYPVIGTDVARFTSGSRFGIGATPWGTRQGDYALYAQNANVHGGGGGPITFTGTEGSTLILPGSLREEVLIHFAFSISALPAVNLAHGQICVFKNENGLIRGGLNVTPTGRLQLFDGGDLTTPAAGTAYTSVPGILITSASPVIEAETWYYLSIRLVVEPESGETDAEVYVGDILTANRVLSGTNLAFTNTESNEIAAIGFLPISAAISTPGSGGIINIDTTTRAVRDIVLCDNLGTYNNDLLGQVFVSAQEMRGSDPGAGWEPHFRQKIGVGILDHTTNRTGLRFADAAPLDLGSSDFTFETFARFDALPGSGETYTLLSKWREATNGRSYILKLDGSDGTLVWSVSTDGTTVTDVKRVPWVPLTDRWYHIAVVRSSAQTLLFVDGVQIGVPVADANTYHDSTAFMGVAAFFNPDGTPATDGRFAGWMDETRFTAGTARYTTDFIPPTEAFPRGVSDPDWSDVVLLMGYDDTTITDESGYVRTVTLASPAPATETPDDGFLDYKVLNQRPAWDDTYVEAPLLPATGVFTFEDVPTDSETMTIGSTVYTWVDSFSGSPAYEVIIGATVADCISNIIVAINGGAGEGTVYGTGTEAHPTVGALTFLSPQFTLQALAAGDAGNAIATTDTMADGFFSDATLTGGQDIPDPSDFSIERLPLDTTGVLGVQVTARAYKTDAGSATIRFDLVGPQTAVDTGDAKSIDLSPAWVRQVFEEDPDTSAGLTPSTLNSGRIRFTRPE